MSAGDTFQLASAILEAVGLIGTLIVGTIAYKMRAEIAEFRNEIKEWAHQNFASINELSHYDRRITRLEEKPSSRALKVN